jgi:hypothetical protein
MSLLVKICECCGCDYRRPTGTSRISDERWESRRYCTATCGVTTTGSQTGDINPGALSAYDHYRANAAISSQNLLNKIMGVYTRVANERGLNDVWEAAVTLGMAA